MSQSDAGTGSVDARLLVLLLVLVGSAAWLAQFLSSTPLVGYDDANIFLVYARNIAGGHGFVYNVGGERVEGFTSPAWVLLCAAATKITTHPEPVLAGINVMAIVAAAYALALYLRDFCIRFAALDRLEAQATALLLTATVVLAPGYIVWTTVSLMDSGLWCANVLLCAICILRICLADGQAESRRGTRRAFLIFILTLAFVRPEAMLWGPLFLSLAVFVEWSTGQSVARSFKAFAVHIQSFAAAMAAQTVFRLIYFGYPLPNTYYAKASGSLADRVREGLSYFADFVMFNPAFLLSILMAMLVVVVAIHRWRAEIGWTDGRRLIASQICVLAMLLASSIVPILEGGDHFGLSRMYQPGWPLVAIQAVHSGSVLFAPPRRLARAGLALFYGVTALIAAAGWTLWPVLPQLSYPSRFAPAGEWNTPRLEMSIAQDMREIGALLDRAFPTYRPSVGVIVAGGFALGYHGTVIDLMGLNTVAMGHSPAPRVGFRDHAAFDPAVFFTLSPDIVLLSLWSPQRPDWFEFPMLSGVFDSLPESTADYWNRRAVSMDAFDKGILKGLLRQRPMADNYAWASVRPATGGQWVHAIFSRTCLARLGGLGYEISFPLRAG
jgi:arabinofuranosyltransferase